MGDPALCKLVCLIFLTHLSNVRFATREDVARVGDYLELYGLSLLGAVRCRWIKLGEGSL